MRLSKSDLFSLNRAADAADAQRELMAMVKRRRNGHVVKDDFAGPVLIAVAVSAAIAVLSVTSFIPQPDQPTTYLSQLSTWSPISGG